MMEQTKRVLRAALRLYCRVPIRGRHRAANRLGQLLAPAVPTSLRIGDIFVPLDYEIEMYRYIAAGVYEDANVRHWRRVLRPGDIFFDGGANVGYTAAIAQSLVGTAGHVFAVEASPTCVRLLNDYLCVNGVTLIEAALSDKAGRACFYDTPRVIDRGFASLDVVAKPFDGVPIEVETVTVDKLMAEHGIKSLRYLKLDVEGAELLALRGATTALKSARIDYVMVETTYIGSHAVTYREISRLLSAYGYSPYALSATGRMIPINPTDMEGQRLDVVWQSSLEKTNQISPSGG